MNFFQKIKEGKVGGSTSGKVNIISNRNENFFILITIIAAYIPTKKVIIVE